MERIRNWRIYRPILSWRIAREIGRWTSADEAAKEFYKELVQPGGLVFDVGANLGKRTKVFLRLQAQVVAVEPQPACVRVLQLAFGRRAVIIPQALAATEGEGEIRIDDSSTISSMSEDWILAVKASGRFATHRWGRTERIRTTTLDRLIEMYGEPSFVKIDVEGYEYEVLRGLSRPIQCLSIENTPEQVKMTEKCLEHLAKLGKIELNYSFGETMQWVFPKWMSIEEMTRFLEHVGQSQEEGQGDVYVRYR